MTRLAKLERMTAPAGTPVTVETINMLIALYNGLVDVVNDTSLVVGTLVKELGDLTNEVDADRG